MSEKATRGKIAVVFPGMGYGADRPLLRGSIEIAERNGFEVAVVGYGGFERGIRGNAAAMRAAFDSALEQSDRILADIDIESRDTVLFISKSLGTAVAAAYASKLGIITRNVFFTPVEQSFQLMHDDGIVFHGTNDPWLKTDLFLAKCRELGYRYYLVEGGNHSLEVGDETQDAKNLSMIMDAVEDYVGNLS